MCFFFLLFLPLSRDRNCSNRWRGITRLITGELKCKLKIFFLSFLFFFANDEKTSKFVDWFFDWENLLSSIRFLWYFPFYLIVDIKKIKDTRRRISVLEYTDIYSCEMEFLRENGYLKLYIFVGVKII